MIVYGDTGKFRTGVKGSVLNRAGEITYDQGQGICEVERRMSWESQLVKHILFIYARFDC